MNEIINVTSAIATYDADVAAGCYCSYDLSTDENKTKLFNAVSNPDKKLTECANLKINLVGVYVEPTHFAKTDANGDETGESEDGTRIILIDDKGVSYSSCSIGVCNAIRRLIAMFGEPSSWKKPITITPVNVTKGTRQFMNIRLV